MCCSDEHFIRQFRFKRKTRSINPQNTDISSFEFTTQTQKELSVFLIEKQQKRAQASCVCVRESHILPYHSFFSGIMFWCFMFRDLNIATGNGPRTAVVAECAWRPWRSDGTVIWTKASRLLCCCMPRSTGPYLLGNRVAFWKPFWSRSFLHSFSAAAQVKATFDRTRPHFCWIPWPQSERHYCSCRSNVSKNGPTRLADVVTLRKEELRKMIGCYWWLQLREKAIIKSKVARGFTVPWKELLGSCTICKRNARIRPWSCYLLVLIVSE